MTIQVRYGAYGESASASSITIPLSTFVKERDIVLVYLLYEGGTLNTVPPRYQQIGGVVGYSGSYSVLYAKVANGMDDWTIPFTFTGGVQQIMYGYMLMYSDDAEKFAYHHSSEEVTITSTEVNYNTSDISAYATNEYALFFSGWATPSTPETLTPDALSSQIYSFQGTNDALLDVTGEQLTVSGEVGDRVATFSDTFAGGTISTLISEMPITNYGEFPSDNGSARTLYMLPEEITGYSLDSPGSFWSVVRAESRTNYIENPSFEEDYFNYSIHGMYYDVTVDKASRGFQSLLIIPSPGDYISVERGNDDVDFESGVITFSIDLYAPTGTAFDLNVNWVGGSVTKSFVVNSGGWHRYSHTCNVLSAAFSMKLLISSPIPLRPIYTDGWQLERGSYPTTYIDGDILGYQFNESVKEYWWNGVAHASSSARSALTKHGGRLVKLDDLETTAIVDAGMPKANSSYTTLISGDELYNGTVTLARDMTVVGRIFECSFSELLRARAVMLELFNPRSLGDGQPSILRFSALTQGGDEYGKSLLLRVLYQDGLGGNLTNFHQNTVSISLHAMQPYWVNEFGSSGGDVGVITAQYVNSGIYVRDHNGEWGHLGAAVGTAADVYGFVEDGENILCFGSFTNVTGVSANRMAYIGKDYDPSFAEYIDGMNGTVTKMISGVGSFNGYVVACGYFTADGNGAGTYRRIAYTDGSTWTELDTGLNGAVDGMEMTRDGDIYWYGPATADNGATTTFVAVGWWDAFVGIWHDMDDGLWNGAGPSAGVVSDMTVGHDGNIYFCGLFNTNNGLTGGNPAGTLTLGNVARWNKADAEWNEIGSISGDVNSIATAPSGEIYATNDTSVYRFNGTSFDLIGQIDGDHMVILGFDTDGVMYIGWDNGTGAIVVGSGVVTEEITKFSPYGRVWLPSDYISELPLKHTVLNLKDGRTVIASDTTDPYTYTTAVTEIEYYGTAETGPVFQLSGPGIVRSIRNNTTGSAIYFDVTLESDEVMIVDLSDKTRPAIYSNRRTNLMRSTIISYSDIANFNLVPGTNHIAILIEDGDDSTFARMRWNNAHLGIENAV